MKKHICSITIVLLIAGGASAYLGQVVASFSFLANPRALARDDAYLYIVSSHNPQRVYYVSPTTGSVYAYWVTPNGRGHYGLAYSSGGHVWISCYPTGYVYDCHSASGSVYRSWPVSYDIFGLAPHCTGDGGAGTTAIFGSAQSPSCCWRHNMTTGSVLSSFPLANPSDYDTAWDHRNALIWMGDSPNVVYGYSTAGSVRASFAAPAGDPRGMAYYGEYLYVGCNANNYIYVVDCPGTLAVDPASLGRVKTLYR